MRADVENFEQRIQRLQSSLKEAHIFNQQHVKEKAEVVSTLLPLWKKAFMNNYDIAEPVAHELQVHPENPLYQDNLKCPINLAKALQQTLYYTSMTVLEEVQEERQEDNIENLYDKDKSFCEEMLDFVEGLVLAEN